MSESTFSLSAMPIGSKAKVNSLLIDGLLRSRLLDLGVVPNSVIEVVRVSPAGDPRAYLIRGALIGLRENEAKQILVSPCN